MTRRGPAVPRVPRPARRLVWRRPRGREHAARLLGGRSLLGQLRNNPQTAAMGVIVTSVLDEPERIAELGVEAYLTKPVCPIALLNAISACGMQICSIDGLQLVVIGAPDAQLFRIIEHLQSAGCEVEQVEPKAQSISIQRADLALVDATRSARPACSEALLARLQHDGTPCLWLIDGEPEPEPAPGRDRATLALLDALCLPMLVRAVHAACEPALKEQGV